MSTKPPSRVVFIGNIPYGLSEEQISEIFSGAGQVLNFRLVYDRETGRPKGFGFAEYPDEDSAASAVRNLNDYEIMNRKLRVDFSNETPTHGNDNDANAGGSRDMHSRAQHDNQNGGGQGASSSTLPPLPAGRELPPGATATDEISRVLHTLPPSQLLDILQQMKDFCNKDPARATELLSQAPQLSYALMQSLLLFDLISPEAIQASLEPGSAAQIPKPAAQQPYNPPVAMHAPAPVVNNAPAQAPAPEPAAGGLPPEVLQQVLQLPQASIDALPPAERASVMALRAQYGIQ